MPKRTSPEHERRAVALWIKLGGNCGPEVGRRLGLDSGTVNKIVRRYGIEVKRGKYSYEDEKRIIELYRPRLSVKDVQKEFPTISKVTVRAIGDRYGIKERGRGGHSETPQTVQAQLVARYKAGETAQVLAAEFSLNKTTVLNTLERKGFARRAFNEVTTRSNRRPLSETHPTIAREWHPTKNGSKNPRNTIHGSSFVASWRCRRCLYEWEAPVVRRTRVGTDCPECLSPRLSKEEVRLQFELQHLLPGLRLHNGYITAAGRRWEVDMVDRGSQLVVEYDGNWFHAKRVTQDRAKTIALESAGWRVVRVRQEPLSKLVRDGVVVRHPFNAHGYASAVGRHLAESGHSVPRLAAYEAGGRAVATARANAQIEKFIAASLKQRDSKELRRKR